MENNNKASLVIVGDICINRADPSSMFASVQHVLRDATITFGNQEVPLTAGGQPIPGKQCLRAAPKNVEALVSSGFDAVGMANNHMMDFGPEGLLDTVKVLDKAGIAHTGGGANIVEAHRPAIVEQNGVKVAFLSLSSVFLPDSFPAKKDKPGIAVVRQRTAYQPPSRVFESPGMPAIVVTWPDKDEFKKMREDIRLCRASADIVVVSWHWGVSGGYGKRVNYQQEMGRAAVDAGADIVVGHHPHSIQGIEVYKGKPIFYSLGNFGMELEPGIVGPGIFGSESMIVRCQIASKKIEQVSFIPVAIRETSEPVLVDKQDFTRIVGIVRTHSSDLGTVIKTRGGVAYVGA